MNNGNKVIIGYDDSPKGPVMEEKPSKEDLQKSGIALAILIIGFFLGRIGIICSIIALVITFLVKKSSVLNLLVRIAAIVEIIVFVVNRLL